MDDMISGRAKTPIIIGNRGMPDLSSNRPNVNRDMNSRGSCPIIDRINPMKHMTSPLTIGPEVVAATTRSASAMIAASSGGPIRRATSAMGAMSRSAMISLEKSPMTEANKAMSRALRACPFRVSAGPSNVVATAAPVPGTEIRIAGMLPPKIPPL